MAWRVAAARGSRGCEDAEGASNGVDAVDGRDDDGDDGGILARGTVDQGSGAQAGKPEPEGSGTGEAQRPSRSAIDRAPRHPSSRNGHPWSVARRRRRRRSNERGTRGPWLA